MKKRQGGSGRGTGKVNDAGRAEGNINFPYKWNVCIL